MDINSAFNIKLFNVGFAKLVEKDGSDISSYFVTKAMSTGDSLAMETTGLGSVAMTNVSQNTGSKALRTVERQPIALPTRGMDSVAMDTDSWKVVGLGAVGSQKGKPCELTANRTCREKQFEPGSKLVGTKLARSMDCSSEERPRTSATKNKMVFPFGMIFVQRDTACEKNWGVPDSVKVKAESEVKWSAKSAGCRRHQQQNFQDCEPSDNAGQHEEQPPCKEYSDTKDGETASIVKRFKGENSSYLSAGIDREVFSQLPTGIQSEILAQQELGPGSDSFVQQHSELVDSRQESVPVASSKLGSKQQCVSPTAATFRVPSGHKTWPSFAADIEASCLNTEAGLSQGWLAARSDPGPSKLDSSKAGQQPTDGVVVPPHMDKAVFMELPQDVQEELVKDWRLEQEFQRMKSRQKSPSTRAKKSGGSIARYFSKRSNK